jgi:hypothetical protein
MSQRVAARVPRQAGSADVRFHRPLDHRLVNVPAVALAGLPIREARGGRTDRLPT